MHRALCLAPGEVHLRVQALDAPTLSPESWLVLSPEERVRADGYLFASDRRRYIAAHAFLRRLLGDYVGVPPEKLRFGRSQGGKPFLESARELRFSLSHSNDHAACAVGHGTEVGVDLEAHRRFRDPARFAERLLSERELERFRDVADPSRDRWLLRSWTVKEAYLKATGAGITRPMREVEIALAEGGTASMMAIGGDEVEATRWTLRETEPYGDLCCALLVHRPHGRISLA